MKKLYLYLFLGLLFSLFTSYSFAAKKHKIYKKLPCHFNGVKITSSAQLHSGVSRGRCCPECKGYKKKRGTTMEVKRGTPVVAIADMKVLKIEDDSSEQRSTSYAKKYGMVEGIDFYSKKKIVKPYDAMRIYFVDTKGNIILYYHLKETHLVPGFNKGKCKIPLEYEWGRKKFRPEDCGGYSKELIKNNLNVKKGQVIGLSGHAYVAHFSLGIAVPPDEEFRNFIIKMTKNSETIDRHQCDVILNDLCHKDGKVISISKIVKEKSYMYFATAKNKKDNLVAIKSEKYLFKSQAKDVAMKRCKLFFEAHGEEMQKSCYIDSIVKVEDASGMKPEYGFKYDFFNHPYSFTGKYMRFTAPQRDFKWENLPTNSDAYLFPVMSKKYLKKIGYKK